MRSKPPVEPPKIGLGVFGFNFGALHAAGAAGVAGADSPPSARTIADAARLEVTDRRSARTAVGATACRAERENIGGGCVSLTDARCGRWAVERGEGGRARAGD